MSRLNCIKVNKQNIFFRERVMEKSSSLMRDEWKDSWWLFRRGVDEILGREGWIGMYDFWQQEEGSFSSCTTAVVEQAHCPGNW